MLCLEGFHEREDRFSKTKRPVFKPTTTKKNLG